MKKELKRVIEIQVKKIVEKEENMSDTDLYNLCLLNKLRDKDPEEIEDLKEE